MSNFCSLLDELQIHSKGFKTVAVYEKQFDLIAENLINKCALLINDRYVGEKISNIIGKLFALD